jgi:hypothetical protein
MKIQNEIKEWSKYHYPVVMYIGSMVLDFSSPDDFGNEIRLSFELAKGSPGWVLPPQMTQAKSHCLTT